MGAPLVLRIPQHGLKGFEIGMDMAKERVFYRDFTVCLRAEILVESNR